MSMLAAEKAKTSAALPLYVGIDIGGTRIKIGLIDDNGLILSSLVVAVSDDRTVEGVIDLILNNAEKVVENHGWESVQGIGIGCPGVIDFKAGIVRKMSNYDWVDAPLASRIQSRTGKKTVVENDANTALLSEVWSGAGKSHGKLENVCMITLGTGVGSAIICNGQLLRGATGMAGEVGHTIIEPHGKRYSEGTGVYGVLEEYASARAVGLIASERVKEYSGHSVLKDLAKASTDSISAKDVLNAAKKGDAFALEIANETFAYIGIACINLSRLLDPDLILLAGGLTASKEFLLEGVRKAYKDHHWNLHEPICEIHLAQHNENGAIIGAAYACRSS